MVWAAVGCAAASAIYAAYQQNKAEGDWQPVEPARPSLDEVAREHRAKMDAMHSETMRGANIGTALLLALIVTAAYGLAQLAGIA